MLLDKPPKSSIALKSLLVRALTAMRLYSARASFEAKQNLYVEGLG